MDKERSGDCAGEFSARQEAEYGNRDLLKEQGKQRSEHAEDESNSQCQQRRRLVNQLRRNFHAYGKSDCGDT